MPDTSPASPPPLATQEAIRSELVLAPEVIGLHYLIHVALLVISLVCLATYGYGLLVSIPVWFCAWALNQELQPKRIRRGAHEALVRFAGGEPQHVAAGMARLPGDRLAGTGIAYRDGRLFVLEGGVAAELPWSRIRSYQWHVAGYTQHTNPGIDMATTIQAASLTTQSYNQALLVSGFFLNTSDIDHPQWRFQTMDVALCQKWNEILKQMSEGTLPSR